MRNTELRIDNGNSGFTVARISGRLDTACTGSVECELAEAAATRLLVVDLAQVNYISGGRRGPAANGDRPHRQPS
jgi:anti-anti-sigma regulatory factor